MSTLLNCPQCGASVDFPEDRLSDLCAFCETPLVPAEGEHAAEPVDMVAPFDLDARMASGRLKNFLRDQRWAPESVRNAARPEETKGVLVPFYVYDATARSTYSGQVGIYWYRTETYTVIVNGKPQIRTRTVRETEWFNVSGSHVHTYMDHLVSGSRGLPEAESNELEPFDVGKALPFEPALIAGALAERPNVGHQEARGVASQELAELENANIRRFLPGDTHRSVNNQTQTEVGQVRLVLLPVWVATYKFKGEVFRLLVNGQTGEVVGKVPRSWMKVGCAIGGCLMLLLAVAGCIAAVGGIGSVVK